MTLIRPTSCCPHCAFPGRWLTFSPDCRWVNYFRCEPCSHVWSVSKDGAEIVQDVTVGPE